MSAVSRQALVPYSPGQMYLLVNDVESYPEFLPWCEAARVVETSHDEIIAEITFAKGAARASFTTRNRLQKDKMVEMQLVNGPFRHLHGFWRLSAQGEEGQGCKISLDLEFELKNALLSATLGPMFNYIANSLVDAYVKRAHAVYGA